MIGQTISHYSALCLPASEVSDGQAGNPASERNLPLLPARHACTIVAGGDSALRRDSESGTRKRDRVLEKSRPKHRLGRGSSFRSLSGTGLGGCSGGSR